MMNSFSLLILSLCSLTTYAQEGECSNCTCPELVLPDPVVCPTNPAGSYVYTTFLRFYADNINHQGYAFGDTYQTIIWTHLFLPPALVVALYAYRMRDSENMVSSWRVGFTGMSTRKMFLWFSGPFACANDIIWFLWLPLNSVIYWTFTVHIVLLVWALWLLYLCFVMSPAQFWRKAKHISCGNASNNIEHFRNALSGVIKDRALVPQVSPDDSGGFVGVIHVDAFTSGKYTVKEEKFAATGSNKKDVICKLYNQANDYLYAQFPPYAQLVAPVVTDQLPMVTVHGGHGDAIEMSTSRVG
jgi:hypothetical protein